MVRRILYVYRFAAHGYGACDAQARVETNLLVIEGKKRAELATLAVESENANQICADQFFDFLLEKIHQRNELSF
jgi:hypothetical protein